MLTQPPLEAVSDYLERRGLSFAAVRTAVASHDALSWLIDLELGKIGEEEFLRRATDAIASELGPTVDLSGFSDFYFGGVELNQPLLARLRELQDGGVRLAILSNNAREWHERWLAFPELGIFDVFVNSALVGVRKPDRRIYELALARVGVDPTACVFLDDLDVNCRTARELGMKAVRFESNAQALPELERALAEGPAATAGNPVAPSGGGSTSSDIKPLYHTEYYLYGVAGHQDFRRGPGGMGTMTTMQRTLALALGRPLRRAVDLGSGRGELAKHLIEQGVETTLVDYAEPAMSIARRYVGSDPLARYLPIEATDLADHVEAGSQDAVFMVNFAEHISRGELREVVRQCSRVLAPHGVVCVHSPERMSGAVLTDLAVEERHINLMDIEDLRQIFRESFEVGHAFTWDGTHAFCEPGRHIALYGVAGQESAFRSVALTPSADGNGALVFRVPPAAVRDTGFALRCEVESGDRPVRGRVAFLHGGRARQIPFDADHAPDSRAVLLLVSNLVHDAEPIDWSTLDAIVLEPAEGAGTFAAEATLITP